MGADFLLAQAELPIDDEGELFLGPSVGNYIKSLITSDPEVLLVAIGPEYVEGDEHATIEHALQVVDYFINQEQALHDREADIRVLGGAPYLFTGGMTWGDPPTSIFDDVNLLAWIADLYYIDSRFPSEAFVDTTDGPIYLDPNDPIEPLKSYPPDEEE